MEILSKIEKKLTSFYNSVVCKLEKTSQKDLLKGNKPLSWWRKITKEKMENFKSTDFYKILSGNTHTHVISKEASEFFDNIQYCEKLYESIKENNKSELVLGQDDEKYKLTSL